MPFSLSKSSTSKSRVTHEHRNLTFALPTMDCAPRRNLAYHSGMAGPSVGRPTLHEDSWCCIGDRLALYGPPNQCKSTTFKFKHYLDDN
ncbi:hypothetical protein DVH24_016719 [Malus domestica]|uniref:Uncharacterized protein n=1 Tax=Malus domestica TaxID=3750 RepID=A0A498HWG8_MALDO|nr:hypothetical protein DVH24_016719 [Malus domestica]